MTVIEQAEAIREAMDVAGATLNDEQAHTSQADRTPDSVPALYIPIGLDDDGYPVWSQPTGAHDAYNNGDIVNYNGNLYRSLVDGNVYSPDAYPAGWEVYTES